MKFSLNFIREFLEVKVSAQKLASLLTMAGLEVSSVDKIGADFSFEAEVTSNRPDLLSVAGIAYESGALLGRSPKLSCLEIKSKPQLDIPIEIEDKQACSLYIGRLIKGVKVAPSPTWLRERLEACGINPVNNVVDITNYCLLKWGQPLHAFDLSNIKEKILVRRAKRGEKLLCIDSKVRELTKEILVIADKERVLALGGIVGGKDSEVTNKTQDILLEAAIFNPVTIRRGRRSLGIDTESSYRFERGVNPLYIERASSEATELICKIAGGKFAGYKKKGLTRFSRAPEIKFDNLKMNLCLGANIKENKSLEILRNLGCSVRRKKRQVFVVPPLFRRDINLAEDLFEEVARVWGYQNIKASLPLIRPDMDAEPSLYRFKEKTREKIARLGFKEIVTFSIEDAGSRMWHDQQRLIKIENPLKAGKDSLRQNLFYGMLTAMANNISKKQNNLEFFEIADVFAKEKESFQETSKICLGSCLENKDNIEEGFRIFKGKIQALLRNLGLDKQPLKEEESRLFSKFFRVGDYGLLAVSTQSDEAGSFHSGIAFLAELDLDKILKAVKQPLFKKIDYLPWVERDISMAVSKDINFENDIENVIKDQAGELFKQLEVIDVYEGGKLPSGLLKAFTLRVFYQHRDRTLETQEVDSLHFKLRDILASKAGIVLR